MIVVSGTSPFPALLTVGEENLLPRLFDEVVMPEAVRNELLRNHGGKAGQRLVTSSPAKDCALT